LLQPNAVIKNQDDDGDQDQDEDGGGKLIWLVPASGHVGTRQAIESMMSL